MKMLLALFRVTMMCIFEKGCNGLINDCARYKKKCNVFEEVHVLSDRNHDGKIKHLSAGVA